MHYFLGFFDSEDDAALAYNQKALELTGGDTKLNIVESICSKPSKDGEGGVREIPLTKGMVALVNTERYDELNKISWRAGKNGRTYYARGRITQSDGTIIRVEMHRIILSQMIGRPLADHEYTDHVNGNGLDNRDENLRLSTFIQNMQNKRPELNKKSKYKGVAWHEKAGKWRAYITCNKKVIFLGFYAIEEQAARAYNKKALELFGEFAWLNEIETHRNLESFDNGD